MKLTDIAQNIGEACKKTTLSGSYDVNVKLNTPKGASTAVFRAVGNDSEKILRLAASAAIVLSGAIIKRQLKKHK